VESHSPYDNKIFFWETHGYSKVLLLMLKAIQGEFGFSSKIIAL